MLNLNIWLTSCLVCLSASVCIEGFFIFGAEVDAYD